MKRTSSRRLVLAGFFTLASCGIQSTRFAYVPPSGLTQMERYPHYYVGVSAHIGKPTDVVRKLRAALPEFANEDSGNKLEALPELDAVALTHYWWGHLVVSRALLEMSNGKALPLLSPEQRDALRQLNGDTDQERAAR